MEKHYLEVPRTARYHSFGNNVNPTEVWLVMHGYGQQAKYFVPKVKALDNGQRKVVVAEALNRFYLSGYNGRVGATWMTKDDREKDILDNHRYLDRLLEIEYASFEGDVELKVLAFSQGIATACRWMAATAYPVKQAVLWAGSIPPDLDWKKEQSKFQSMDITYVVGKEDEFFDPDKISMNLKLLDEASIGYQLVTFEGKHEMNEEVLLNILS